MCDIELPVECQNDPLADTEVCTENKVEHRSPLLKRRRIQRRLQILKRRRNIRSRPTIRRREIKSKNFAKNVVRVYGNKNHIPCIEERCSQMFETKFLMIKHVKNDHIPRYNSISAMFRYDSDFERWKLQFSVRDLMMTLYADKLSSTSAASYQYFVCSYSEQFIRYTPLYARIGKMKQRCIYGCPAKLLVYRTDCGIFVKYFPHTFYYKVMNGYRSSGGEIRSSDRTQVLSSAYYDPRCNGYVAPDVNKSFNDSASSEDSSDVENKDTGYVYRDTGIGLLKNIVKKHLRTIKSIVNDPYISKETLFHIENAIGRAALMFDAIRMDAVRNSSHAGNSKWATDLSQYGYSFQGRCGSFTPPIGDLNKINETLYNKGGYTVSLLHLKSLDHNISIPEHCILSSLANDFERGWLYDAVIDAFLYTLCEQRQEIMFLGTAIGQMIHSNSLSTMVTQLRHKNLSDIEIIFVPCNPTRKHWVLLVVNVKLKHVEIFDPASASVPNSKRCGNFIRSMIVVLLNDFGNDDVWDVVSPPHIVQKNCYDCGVYICWYAERITNQQDALSDFDPAEYRKHIYDTIVDKKP